MGLYHGTSEICRTILSMDFLPKGLVNIFVDYHGPCSIRELFTMKEKNGVKRVPSYLPTLARNPYHHGQMQTSEVLFTSVLYFSPKK